MSKLTCPSKTSDVVTGRFVIPHPPRDSMTRAASDHHSPTCAHTTSSTTNLGGPRRSLVRSSRRRTSSSCSLSVGLTSRWSLFLTVLPSGTCANVNVGGTGPRCNASKLAAVEGIWAAHCQFVGDGGRRVLVAGLGEGDGSF